MTDMLVWPRDDQIKKVLKHPTGRGFSNYPDGSPWPRDQFTLRRIKEGAITTEKPRPATARRSRRSSTVMEN